MRISDEVADALARGAPVVCLETTLVAHGFPQGEGYAVGASS
jgi:pseudouridine-5'-phosphate glycosidase